MFKITVISPPSLIQQINLAKIHVKHKTKVMMGWKPKASKKKVVEIIKGV